MRRAAVLLLVAATTSAHAQNADLTREFQAGIDSFRLGKFDEARAHLEKARDIDPKLPGPYRFLAAVAQAQGKWDDCIASAHKALELNPQSSETADTRKLYEECRLSAGHPKYVGELADNAAIAVTTNVSGATVKINGLTYGATPMAPRPITPGPLEIEIEKQGWKSAKLSPNALAGIVTDVIVDLEPDPNATANANELQTHGGAKIEQGWLIIKRPVFDRSPLDQDSSLEQEGYIDGVPLAQVPKAPDSKTDSPRFELKSGTHVVELRTDRADVWRRRVRISAGQKIEIQPMLVNREHRSAIEKRGVYVLGGGAVLLATGFVATLISQRAAAEARDIVRIETARDPSQPLSQTGMIAPVRTRADLEDAAGRATTFARISYVAYGTGLAAVGVAAYYFYKGAKERDDVPPPFAIAPTRGGVFVAKEIAW